MYFYSGLILYSEQLEYVVCTITIRHLPWIRGDFKARMGHQITFNLTKTGRNVFSQSLQFRVLFIRDFEPAIQDLFTSFKPIIMLVWVTPISNLKYFFKNRYRLFFLRSIAQFFTQIYMNCFVSS